MMGEGAQGSDKRSLVAQLRIQKREKSTIGNKPIHHTATLLRGQVIASISHRNVLTCKGFLKSKCWIFVETASLYGMNHQSIQHFGNGWLKYLIGHLSSPQLSFPCHLSFIDIKAHRHKKNLFITCKNTFRIFFTG